MTINKQALEDALDFDLFASDFGDSDDVEFSNKIVTGPGQYTCFICLCSSYRS